MEGDLIHTTFREHSAKFISNVMNDDTTSNNLNTISHNSAIDIINHFLNKGLALKHAYIDTVGPPDSYREKLERIFSSTAPDLKFTVCSKADDLFPVTSAASIVAKVQRDKILRNWEFKENPDLKDREFGCGYPSDPKTKLWLKNNFEPLFGYPDLIRFSWKTIYEAQFTNHGLEHEFKSDCNNDGILRK